jgi:3-methyladenine DNA glycosylase AlkC
VRDQVARIVSDPGDEEMAYKKLKFWFDKDLARLLAEKILGENAAFDAEGFVNAVAEGTESLELKDRVALFAAELHQRLPQDYTQAVGILCRILGPENQQETGMFTEGYWIMPIAKFVEDYGLDDFEVSMFAIEEITKRNTGEYCIRPYIVTYPEKTLARMEEWTQDESVHVRRLASEGVRPRLPWAKKLDKFVDDPQPVLTIIENLKDDPSRFVQTSVANNLNDILKDNYVIGMKTIKKWAKDATPHRKWIIKHALRNQLKQGNPEAERIMATLS